MGDKTDTCSEGGKIEPGRNKNFGEETKEVVRYDRMKRFQ